MLKNHLKLHLLVLLWGFTGIVGKLVHFQAVELVFWRVLIAFFVLLVAFKMMGISITADRKSFLKYVGAGAVIGLHWILFFWGIKVSNVSVVLSTLSTGALFSALLEPFFFRRKIVYYEVILALIVSACLSLIFWSAGGEYWLGILLGILASFLSALFSIFNSIFLKSGHSPYKATLYEMLGSLFLVTLCLPFFVDDFSGMMVFKGDDFWWILVLATFLTAYPMTEAVKLFRYFSPYTMLLTINLEPVYGVVLAYFIFGESEQMSYTFYIVSAVMLGIIVLNEVIKHQFKRRKEKLENSEKL